MVNFKVVPTDSIPRVSIQQILETLTYIQRSNKTNTFDEIRFFLQQRTGRKTPSSREWMWTVARDILTDLHRLELIKAGVLPRKRSEVERLRDTPVSITKHGIALAQTYATDRGRAFDELLQIWLRKHPYFRLFVVRLLGSPLYVPDVTSVKQIAPEGVSKEVIDTLAERIIQSCLTRLPSAEFSEEKRVRFSQMVNSRVNELRKNTEVSKLDTKKIIDLIEDTIVLPSLLSSEELPFDKVTFQHLLQDCEEFFCATWTSSHPDFQGRIIFSTCDFSPDIIADPTLSVISVLHHGQSFAIKQFSAVFIAAYQKLVGVTAGYADAYALRAVVSAELRIQPQVFATCLESFLSKGQMDGFSIYTELPFSPPPPGETYIEVSKRRIGRVKLTS